MTGMYCNSFFPAFRWKKHGYYRGPKASRASQPVVYTESDSIAKPQLDGWKCGPVWHALDDLYMQVLKGVVSFPNETT